MAEHPEKLKLPLQAFRLVVGDTDLTADAGKTSASRQTLVSGNAARLASEDLRRKILALANAGPRATLALDGARLTISDGEAHVDQMPIKRIDGIKIWGYWWSGSPPPVDFPAIATPGVTSPVQSFTKKICPG